MVDDSQRPHFTKVEPMSGESLSHFLGRFRRTNYLSAPGTLGRLAGVGTAIGRWEKLYFSPAPKPHEVEALAVTVNLSPQQVIEMLPAQSIRHSPVWLCGACYEENPCHQMQWQLKQTGGCDRHQLRLLSACPTCGSKFATPALWIEGICQRCYTPFIEMIRYQKAMGDGANSDG